MLEQENDLSLASSFERGSKNKDLSETNPDLDSGFLSGPQQIFSGELSSGNIDSIDLKSKDSRSHHSSSTKSQSQQKGASIDSDTFVDLGISADLSSSQMKTYGGETGLSDWFNNLSVKDPSKNDLDTHKEKPIPPSLPCQTLWKICYAQDNDGDTWVSFLNDSKL